MTVRAPAGTTGRLRRWLSARNSLGLEAALVLTLYGVNELARGREHTLHVHVGQAHPRPLTGEPPRRGLANAA